MVALTVPASRASTSATTPSITCSQLSSTSSVRRAARCASSRSISGVSPASRRPSTAAQVATTRVGILQRREVDEPDTVGKRLELLSRELQRQARLAAAADAGQRQQPRLRHEARQVGQRCVATDEARARLRQVVVRRADCRAAAAGKAHSAWRRNWYPLPATVAITSGPSSLRSVLICAAMLCSSTTRRRARQCPAAPAW